MDRISISKNFFADEYFPKTVYMAYKRKGFSYEAWIRLLLRKLNPALVKSDQLLRDRFGPITINDWWHGGIRINSGIRFCGSNPGAEFTDHFQGLVSDKKFSNISAAEVIEDVETNFEKYGITIIEKQLQEEYRTWLHSGISYVKKPLEIILVNLK